MAHRSVPRDVTVGSLFEAAGSGETEKHRVTRRGRSATPGFASHWEENRRLYMDNLRLWDCLTLVRSDPTMTCQNAIKLVFSLNDDDYFRMFPDTRQLMLLMFPGGVVYHSSSEEARIENARLKDENARLHAAVWVLRDNPSFQADSTVAAIFRLDEAQFQSKFHSVSVATFVPAQGTSKVSYQNNNREKKKTIRTSLDLGQEPKMAIQLTNCPIKMGGFAYDKPGSKVSRHPRSQSMIPPTCHLQNSNGCYAHHQDFTSNWKPTTPQEQHPTGGKIRTSKQSHLKTDWAILCWRQNYYLRPVDLYALEGTRSTTSVRHDKPAQNSSQKKESSPRHGKERQLRRSNTVSREEDVAAERISKSPSHAAPVKCVSFAEPLPSYQTDSSKATKLVSLQDKVSMILDTSSGYGGPVTREEMPNHCTGAAGEAEVCDLKKNADIGSAKNANYSKRNRKSDARSKVYTLAAAREPSKRCQRDTATSPVLDTRTCVLILGEPGRSKMANSYALPVSSASDDYILNKSNNNDTNAVARPAQCCEPDLAVNPDKCSHTRPLSPKQRNLRQARLKNMLACKKLNTDLKLKQKHIQDTCSTNNAINQRQYTSIFPRTQENSAVIRYSLHNRGRSENNAKGNDDEEYETEIESSNTLQSAHSSHTRVPDIGPRILFSEKPATAGRTKHAPYSLAPYTTVKQYLDRHDKLLHGLPLCSPFTSQETFTDDIASEMISAKKPPSVKQLTDIAESSVDSDRFTNTSMGQYDFEVASLSQNQLLAQKYKDKWNRSETLLLMRQASKGSHLKSTSDTTAKLKLCEDPPCNTAERLDQLRKLGNYKYSQPMAAMLKRNGCLQRRRGDENMQPTRHLVLRAKKSSLGSKMYLTPLGPFITFIPKK